MVGLGPESDSGTSCNSFEDSTELKSFLIAALHIELSLGASTSISRGRSRNEVRFSLANAECLFSGHRIWSKKGAGLAMELEHGINAGSILTAATINARTCPRARFNV